jgi:hypothetical protein
MSLTLNTFPNRIDSAAAFNITTSLSEDASHVNLRIRADVYHEGIIKATIEKPKGLNSFDFSEILKSLTPGLLIPRDSGDIAENGTIGSNLITSWMTLSGTWDTLTSSVNAISSAIKSAAAATYAKTNDITMTAGKIYLFYSANFATAGANRPYGQLVSGDSNTELIYINKGIIIMPTSSGTKQFYLGHNAGAMNFSGTFYIYEITTNRTTIGNPLAPYFVNFTEVYEDAAGVTTLGGTYNTFVFRFVPAYGDGIAFTEYVMHANNCYFANKTFRNNIAKIFTVTPYEYWIQYFTEFVELELSYSKDGAGIVHTTHPVCYEGWGVIILNVGEILATVAATLAIYLKESSGAGTQISETLTAYVDATQIDERVLIEFDGLVGGKEYLAFEGIKSLSFSTIRNYYKSAKLMNKPLSLTGICKQKIATRFKDINNAEYLKSLLISEIVKRLEASYAAATPVTITTDSVVINQSDLFSNTLDMEYEY